MADASVNSGLTDFLSHFGWASRSVATVAAAAPVVLLVEAVRPDTAVRSVDYLLVAAASFITAVFVYVRYHRRSKRWHGGAFLVAVALAGIFAVAYAVMFSKYTELDVRGERYVKGYEYSARVVAYKRLIREARDRGEPLEEVPSDRELVIDFENDPANVWTRSGIVRLAFLLHGTLTLLAIPVSAAFAFLILAIPRPHTSASVTAAGMAILPALDV